MSIFSLTVKNQNSKIDIRATNISDVFLSYIAFDTIKHMGRSLSYIAFEKTYLKRMGEPEDIANAFLFLSSNMGRYVNGTVLSVDGGVVI